MALSEKQKLFCLEYIKDNNATQAAIRAGYSKKTAYAIGSENLKKLEVQEYLKKIMESKDSELIASGDEVLQTLTRILRREEKEHIVITCKVKKSYFDENGKKVIEESEEPQVVEIPTKIFDVNKAAESLGKSHQLFTVNYKIDGIASMVFYGENEIKE